MSRAVAASRAYGCSLACLRLQVEEFEAQGFVVRRLDLPPDLAAGRCGVYHMRKCEERRSGGGTGGGGGGGVGGGVSASGGEEGEEEAAEEEAVFEERLQALVRRGELGTIKALLREREARHTVSHREGGA